MTDDLETKKQFAAMMYGLYKAFGREPDKVITGLFFQGMSHLTIEDAATCVTFAITQGDKFPTIHDMRRFVSQIPAKPMRQVEYKNRHSDMPKDAEKLIELTLSGKITKENLIEGMMVMHQKYPGCGWSSEASALAAYYSREDREEICELPL